MKIREIECKSALVKSKLPGCDYVINPYVGCQHACVYCYSRFMKRFTGHKEDWGHFLDAKMNIVDVLKKELPKAKRELALLSSVTDPYVPAESKYKLTRRILEELLKYQWPIAILTKSALVLRDLDLLKQFKNIDVGLTITSTSDEVTKAFEPLAAPASARLATLKELHEEGISTYCFMGPILPELTDLENIFSFASKHANEIWCESLNTKGANWFGVEQVLKAKWPKLLPKYKKIFFDKENHKEYLKNLEKELLELGKKYKIKVRLFLEHK
jgi:DNA repair photolyase